MFYKALKKGEGRMERPHPNFLMGALIGVVVATAFVLFLTPFSGAEIRKDI